MKASTVLMLCHLGLEKTRPRYVNGVVEPIGVVYKDEQQVLSAQECQVQHKIKHDRASMKLADVMQTSCHAAQLK